MWYPLIPLEYTALQASCSFETGGEVRAKSKFGKLLQPLQTADCSFVGVC